MFALSPTFVCPTVDMNWAFSGLHYENSALWKSSRGCL